MFSVFLSVFLCYSENEINPTVLEVFQCYEIKSIWYLSFFCVFELGFRFMHPFPEKLFGNFPFSILHWPSFDINDVFASGSELWALIDMSLCFQEDFSHSGVCTK